MKFQFVMMTINNLQIPMIRLGKESYITQGALSKLLGVGTKTLRNTYQKRRDEFEGLCAHSMGAIEFLKEHKELLGLNYVRGDMHLWSKHDMLVFAMLVRGPRGIELRKELVRFIEDNAVENTISRAEYENTVGHLEKQVCQLREELEMVRPALKAWAKISGKSLQMQKGTKHLRDLN